VSTTEAQIMRMLADVASTVQFGGPTKIELYMEQGYLVVAAVAADGTVVYQVREWLL
jgi:hypothetical protein